MSESEQNPKELPGDLDHVHRNNLEDNGPTEDDEMEVLGSLYAYDSKLGVFHTPLFEEE